MPREPLHVARETVRVLRVRSGIRAGDAGQGTGTGITQSAAVAVVNH